MRRIAASFCPSYCRKQGRDLRLCSDFDETPRFRAPGAALAASLLLQAGNGVTILPNR
jgi:hypothetical protein